MQEQRYTFTLDNERLLEFGDLDYSIHHAILSNRERLVDMRVADIAKAAGVSNASVIRFCKKCGFSGLPDLKKAFLAQEEKQEPVCALSDVDVELRRFAVDETYKKEFLQRIDDAYELLRWARGVLFLGSGRSSGLAIYGSELFGSIGLVSVPVVTFPSHVEFLAKPEGVAIVLSCKGSNPLVLNAMQKVVSQGMAVVSITANPSGPIARLSDVCISYKGLRKCNASVVGLTSQVPALFAIEQLARMLYNEEHVSGYM